MDSAIRKRNLLVQFQMDSAGYVSKESFCIGIKKILKIGDDSLNHFIDDIFVLCDGKGMFNAKDDKLNRRELDYVIEAIPETSSGHVAYDLAEIIFNIINSNNDQMIDINEFKTYVTKILKSVKNSDLKEAFKTLSNNTNGIQKQVFLDYIVKVINGIIIEESKPEEEVKEN